MTEAGSKLSDSLSDDIVHHFVSSSNLLRAVSEIGRAAPAADPQVARRVLTSLFTEIRLRGGHQHLDQLERAIDGWPNNAAISIWTIQELVKLRVRLGAPATSIRDQVRSVLDGTYPRQVNDESEFAAFVYWVRYATQVDLTYEIAASVEVSHSNWDTYAAIASDYFGAADSALIDGRLSELLSESVRDGDHVLVHRVMNLRGQNAWERGRSVDAEHWFRRMLAECDATGDPTRATAMRLYLVKFLIEARRLEEARLEVGIWAARVAAENLRSGRCDVVRDAMQLARVSGDKRWLISFVDQLGWTTIERMCDWVIEGAQAAIKSWVECVVVEAASALALPGAERLLEAALKSDIERSVDDETRLILACGRLFPERARWAELPRLIVMADLGLAEQALAAVSRAAVIERISAAREVVDACVRFAEDRAHSAFRFVLAEVSFATNRDWQGCAEHADALVAAGLSYDAALVRCVAFVLAAEQAHGAQADRLFEQSHEALAELGLEHEIARIRHARSRLQPGAADRRRDRSAAWQAFASTWASDVMVSRTIARGQRFPTGYFGMLVEGAGIVEPSDEDGLPDIIGAGELFHVRSCIGLPELSVLTSLTACELSLVPVSAVAAELRSSPALAGELLRWSVERADQNLHRALCGVRDPLRQRVARALRLLIDRVGVQLGEDDWRIPITGVTLAKFVGAKRESTSRVTAQFGREGLLEFVDRSIVVHGREKLASIEALPE